ncbi:E3 ubiquitin-protein ligase TRIM35-like [Corythoichthys intestinalis]|uniref:E3 ubiquitin-protein ligase TRIM35-like n=1 Tax=Corythoichthys intestinalis TaxID=161448 RepID=UPI0025A5304F|nr:E3 ubiquitin-protein ligase TRIM35-like [Corythoichthys intestinalis]XP_061801616.1 E3 ubiquitin-protein ligase TRIM35-like [Nerophis lumbriciformis]
MAGRVEDHLQCPTCLDVFKDPVMLSCSHIICRACLQQWKDKGEKSCPVCRTGVTSPDPPLNLALRNVCEKLSRVSVKSKDLCSLHEEKLKLFCLDHQELVCCICRDAKIHAGHKYCPVDEALQDLREALHDGLNKAKRRLKEYHYCRENCKEQSVYIKVQREKVESKIKMDFEELRDFLQVEEVARLSAVREEEKKKSQTMKEKIAALSRKMAALSDVIRSTEEQLMSDHLSFLKNFQTAMSSIHKLPVKPMLSRGALLDEAKHLGNLKYCVWEQMKEIVSYSPVILDQNTAHQNPSLSEDLTSVIWKGGNERRPNNPERFKWNTVLGSALDPGRHEWEVEVGYNIDWEAGVVSGNRSLPGRMHCWRIGFLDGEYRSFSDPFGSWNPPVKLQRIRFHVDMTKRSLSCSESLTNTELCEMNSSDWPDLSSNIKMYPYFLTMDENVLRIIPRPPSYDCSELVMLSERFCLQNSEM